MTPFQTGTTITLTKTELDSAVKDKKCVHFPADFKVEITFAPAEAHEFKRQKLALQRKQAKGGFMEQIRGKVSKKKLRFVQVGVIFFIEFGMFRW